MTQKQYHRNEDDYFTINRIGCMYCDRELATKDDFDFHLAIRHQEIWNKRCK